MYQLISYIKQKPLKHIFIAAILLRLVAVIWSAGYGMHDDQFDVIEPAQAWIEHKDLDNWLPEKLEDNRSGRSFFYPGIHYLFFKTLEKVGIASPENKMIFVRLLHALLSLSVILFGYKIAKKISGDAPALWVALALSVFWFQPYLSVRCLVETVISGPMLAATWLYIRKETTHKIWELLLAGILLGLCFVTRYQSFTYTGILFLIFVFRKDWRVFLFVLLGFVSTFLWISGWLEYYVWGYPFGKFLFYLKDNFGFLFKKIEGHSGGYDLLSGFNYILQIIAMLIPPIGILVFIFSFKNIRIKYMIFWPTIGFLVFHILFPNRQERFIFTILPMIILLGIPEVYQWYQVKKENWKKYVLMFSASINLIALALFTPFYSKSARIDAMKCVGQDTNLGNIILDTKPFQKSIGLPIFYCNKKFPEIFEITVNNQMHGLKRDFELRAQKGKNTYLLFLDTLSIKNRLDSMHTIFPKTKFLQTCMPSKLDYWFYKLNKINLNQQILIYKLE